MNLKLLDFIKNNPTDWKDKLSKPPYAIDIKENNDYMLLKYNQIESKFNDINCFPVIRECRGIILKKDNFIPCCIPFFKFGNYGESYADKIDWNTARVQDKIDGSLIKVWFENNNWNISTNGTINAFEAKCPTGETFGDLFLECVDNTPREKFNSETFWEFCNSSLNKYYTYMFEMVHHLTRVVIRYDKPMVFHIGTRNNITGEEIIQDIGIQHPKEYKFNSLEDVIAIAQTLPYSEEGYVVVDNNWNRVKVKSPSYVAVHHLKNSGVITYKRIMELVFKGETEEFLIYFPEFKPYIDKADKAFKNYVEQTNIVINNIKDKKFETRKDYALVVTKTQCPDFFFKVLDGKYDWNGFYQYNKDGGAEKLAKILKLKDEKVKEADGIE
jgi:hypothetical protein